MLPLLTVSRLRLLVSARYSLSDTQDARRENGHRPDVTTDSLPGLVCP